jgi:putative transcriptional regulator
LRITHHLDATTILALASGTLDEALGVVAASHVWWCAKCRDALKEAERLRGYLLNKLTSSDDAVPPADGQSAGGDSAAVGEPQQALAENMGLPLPVASRLGGMSLSDIRWRWAVPGLSLHELAVAKGGNGRLFLMRIGPGKAVPQHGHGGEELTLILRGSYRDRFGRFAIGDIAELHENVVHRPIVDKQDNCICLVATQAPARFTSLIMRMIQPFVRI